MEQALERIAREEEHPSRRRLTRRQVVAVVVAALLILSMAMAAALGRNVIDFFTMGNVTDSQRMIQKNLAHASFDHCDITIREAAYDGMSLYILYAVQDRDATQPWACWTRTPGRDTCRSPTPPACRRTM